MPGTVLRRIAPANPQAPTGYSRQRGVVDEPGDGVVADPVDRPCIAHRDGRIEPTAVWVVVPAGRGDLPGRSGFTPEV